MSTGTKMTLNRYGKSNYLNKTDFDLVIDSTNIGNYSLPIFIDLPQPYNMGRGELDVHFNGQYLAEGGGYAEITPTRIQLDIRDNQGNPSPLNIGDEIFIRMWGDTLASTLEIDKDKFNSLVNEVTTARNQFPQLGNRLDAIDSRIDSITTFSVRKIIVFVIPGTVKVGVQPMEIRFPFSGKLVEVYASCRIPSTDSTVIQVQKVGELLYEGGNESDWQSVLDVPLELDANTKSSKASANPYIIGISDVAKDDHFRIDVTSLGNGIKDITVEVVIDT